MNSIKMDNENFIESDAIIRIFGFCVNPLVTINDNIYQIDVSLEVGEYLEIDTEKSTIFKYTIYGDKVNCFNNRNKKSPKEESYIDIDYINAVVEAEMYELEL